MGMKTTSLRWAAKVVSIGLLPWLGCGGVVPLSDSATESIGTSSSSMGGTVTSETTGGVTSTTSPQPSSETNPSPVTGTTGDSTSSSGSGDEGPDTGLNSGFVIDPDGGGCGGFGPGVMAHCSLCSYFEQLCVRGESCKPTDQANAGTWTRPTCQPRPPGADGQPGSPCEVEDGPFSGIDTCESSMCWNVDADTSAGTCVAFCSSEVPCDDPMDTCFEGNDGFVPICLPSCSPVAQNCPAGQGCYPGTQTDFVCIREGEPLYNDAQTLHPQCDAGSFMTTVETPGACVGEACCGTFCDLTEPDCVDGSTCEPFYPELDLSDVGYCALPEE